MPFLNVFTTDTINIPYFLDSKLYSCTFTSSSMSNPTPRVVTWLPLAVNTFSCLSKQRHCNSFYKYQLQVCPKSQNYVLKLSSGYLTFDQPAKRNTLCKNDHAGNSKAFCAVYEIPHNLYEYLFTYILKGYSFF
ncbi:hypothetical protein AX774_g1294 [Zancudomyces culisetae]|uniref:Uncharacterized protein n=1 Tax=Zancudomyces culisetae TaxID=1213189 RepID=A0A1R1PW11_ZANCU|nr:hypothetical protein AX774_g1294 [Zancudomyces culisetae]|eukprot:OMH85151.1 hypothetical protein AX774_g1294 [Zancudomyces culisetae]